MDSAQKCLPVADLFSYTKMCANATSLKCTTPINTSAYVSLHPAQEQKSHDLYGIQGNFIDGLLREFFSVQF